MARTKNSQELDFKIRTPPGPRNRTLGRQMPKRTLGRAATSHKRARAERMDPERAKARYEAMLDGAAPSVRPPPSTSAEARREEFEGALESLARAGMAPDAIERLRAAAAREREE